jgi:hypothetical protein
MSTKHVLPKRITLAWLRRHGAYKDMCDVFAETFPDGVDKITARAVGRAKGAGLPLDWMLSEACVIDRNGPCYHYRFSCASSNAEIAASLRELQARKVTKHA